MEDKENPCQIVCKINFVPSLGALNNNCPAVAMLGMQLLKIASLMLTNEDFSQQQEALIRRFNESKAGSSEDCNE
ncbi:hypothetical protein [Desulfovibrio piger]|uniref:hypothetical protein n=1 Tax=Desulfovibrio piger TaxID=901 RepID=UPI0026EBC6EC|nr:hypothetical protein [Desulfovibrio piger]